MKPFSKSYWWNACGLLLGGIVLTGVSIAAGAWDETKYAEALNLETHSFDGTETISNVSITADTANIKLQKLSDSNDKTYTLTATNVSDDSIQVSLENETLSVVVNQQKPWHGISFGIITPTTELTLSLPEKIYESVRLETEVGDLQILDLQADALSIETNTGDQNLQNCTCQELSTSIDVGNGTFQQVTAQKTSTITTDTGDLLCTDSTLNGISTLQTNTGDLQIKNSTLAQADLQTDTGDLLLEHCIVGTFCDMATDVGDITVSLDMDADTCSVDAETEVGEVLVNGRKGSQLLPNAEHTLKLRSDVGDIHVAFEKAES